MRVVVRHAVVAALKATFTQSYPKRPYEILMLGGDDLLLACRADKALEFVLNYGRELEKYELADGHALHVAIGVAIAQKSYPLHRLQELAESLASSAKRLYRAQSDREKTSVVDWQVVTQSWFEGVAEARQQSDLAEYTTDGRVETLLLTARPYSVFGDDGLEGLLAATHQLDGADSDERAARSPLRSLHGFCQQGRLAGEMEFARFPKDIQSKLGWKGEEPKLWMKADKAGKTFYLTKALDIIGIREIARLGRKKGND
jgi:hypothetical protein